MTAYMKALNPGTWLLNCMNGKFFDDGMSALFDVTDCGKGVALPTVSGGETRNYYIAADEVIWDYGPTGDNNIDGKSLTSPKRCIQQFIKSFGQATLRLNRPTLPEVISLISYYYPTPHLLPCIVAQQAGYVTRP